MKIIQKVALRETQETIGILKRTRKTKINVAFAMENVSWQQEKIDFSVSFFSFSFFLFFSFLFFGKIEKSSLQKCGIKEIDYLK
jgi:hypothetical protein